MIDNILEQLKNYCSCNDEIDPQDLNELINIISMITCWNKKGCETFLLEERKEVIELPKCSKCLWEFEPYYKPFQADSFKFILVKQKDGIEEFKELDAYYSEIDEIFRVDLDMACNCGCNNCCCKPTYKMLVTYNAGYEEIPECILPIFCNYLELIQQKNTCECEECTSCKKDKDDITYLHGDILSVELERELILKLKTTYKNMLNKISLCKNKTFWMVRADDC